MAVALDAIPQRSVQMKIAALAPFPFVGLEFGGAERIQNLLTRVDHPIEVFTPNYGPSQTSKFKNLSINYVEVPEAMRVHEFDLVIAKNSGPLFADKLADYDPDLVILEHPWQADALTGQKYVYDAHNNEAAMKRMLKLENSVEETMRVEAIALSANHVTYCSEDDNLVTDSRKTFIPNGTDIPYLPMHHGVNSNVLLFVGSAHPPNIGAALTLTSLAKAMPEYHVVIAGNCSLHIQSDLPNVTVLGHVDAKMLDYLMRTSHAFVNIIAAGAGTSLKVARAMSYGLPVISSAVGARGYAEGCIITKNAQDVLDSLVSLTNPKSYQEAAQRARAASEQYSWDSVGARFNLVIEEALNDRG